MGVMSGRVAPRLSAAPVEVGRGPLVAAGRGGGGGSERTKPIWGEVVWGEGFREGGPAGSTTGAGAAAGSAESFSRARRARSRARRVASTRYWSLVKVPGLMDAEYPRGYFFGSRNLSSLWHCHIWVSTVDRKSVVW